MKPKKICWNASSIPECVIASVILMMVFLMSLEILSQMILQTPREQSAVSVNLALQKGFAEFGDGRHSEGSYSFIYDGLKVEASLTVYGIHMQKLVLSVFSSRNLLCVKRYHIIEKQHEL